MTQKDKDLVLKDLCARLPYGVKCDFHDDEIKTSQLGKLQSISITRFKGWNEDTIDVVGKSDNGTRLVWSIYGVRPYLRPMSSMTDEEQNELDHLRFRHDEEGWLEFVLSRHLDWRGLIGKGLALEASEGMYKI